MNDRAKSVIWYVVKGEESRGGEFFGQPVNVVELLLQRKSCVSQELETAEQGKKWSHEDTNREGDTQSREGSSYQLSYSWAQKNCMRSVFVFKEGASYES